MEQMHLEGQQGKNAYIINPENAAEMARLLDQDKMTTESMGGLFPERDNVSNIFDVLDIACGPGGWVHDVAHTYPEMDIIGVDVSQRMIEYAKAHAQVRQLPNAKFQVMDVLQPLKFADASFDLVNMRFIFGFITLPQWPRLFLECKRILRPNGIIRITEVEGNITNLPFIDRYLELLSKALYLDGHSFSPTGRHIGVVHMLKRLLSNAGFHNIHQRAYSDDFSFGSRAYQGVYEDLRILFKLIQPLLIKTQLATQTELDILYEQAMTDFASEEFCGLSFLVTFTGENN